MRFIRIQPNDTMTEIQETLSGKNVISKLKKHILSSGNNNLMKLYSWTYENNTLECYGWHDGEAGFENKHEAIPSGVSDFLEENSSDKLLFGDIFMCLKKKKKYMELDIAYYGQIYQDLCQGFDSCESEEEEDELPTEEDKAFIVNDSDEEIVSANDTDDEELFEEKEDEEDEGSDSDCSWNDTSEDLDEDTTEY